MVLLGSVQRVELEYMLDSQIGRATRLFIVAERNKMKDGAGTPSDEKVTVVEFHARVSLLLDVFSVLYTRRKNLFAVIDFQLFKNCC